MGVMRRRTIIAVVAAGIVVAVAAGGYVYVGQRHQAALDDDARAAADHFAEAWSQGKLKDVAYAGETPDQVAASYAATTAGLHGAPATVKVTGFTRHGETATGTLAVSWAVTEAKAWSYTMPITVDRDKNATWAVVATSGAAMWAPGLGADATLNVNRVWGARGDVLDRNGAPLLTTGTVYDVQIDPVRATSATIAELEKLVDEPAGSLVTKLEAAQSAGSKAAIPVITYREADFQARKAKLDALVGVVYPPRQQPLAPSATFARPLLGSYGAVTADSVTKGKGRYVAGDYAGMTGLQGQYDALLGGTPGITVTASDKPDAVLFSQDPTPGGSMTLTLDPTVQSAAEAALAGTGSVPSSLVAVDVTTGDLLAVANSPSRGADNALLGQYPPGSTLKVATTYSLLSKGLDPSTPVSCPASVVVDGRKLQNYEGETFGTVPFSVDFAHSCNTAFIQLAATMGDGDVHDAAAALGVGAGWEKHLGIDGAFGGSVPVATTATEKAATAFGQAKTLASTASLAVMAGSVARGSYIEPALITSPAVEGADRTPKALDPATVDQLRQLMRLVVTDGTGSVLKSVPGEPVYGKTGTAEYGTDSPPKTRAWFIGWQGNVAFAVLVEDGTSGGTVAAPIAKTFLQGLGH